MIAPAMSVATKAKRSVRMCWKAPSTLRLSRLALLMVQVASRLTTMPKSAMPKTRPPSTSGGDQAPYRLVDEPGREQEQRDAVGLGGEDFGALEAVGQRPAGGPSREANGDEGQGYGAGVGEHVPGVGDQSQGGGYDADNHLYQHEPDEQR